MQKFDSIEIIYWQISTLSGYRCGVNETALLGYYEAWIGSYVPTFRDKLSVPFSRIKQSKKGFFLDCLAPENGEYGLSRNVGT
jgi:hypothetical protein